MMCSSSVLGQYSDGAGSEHGMPDPTWYLSNRRRPGFP